MKSYTISCMILGMKNQNRTVIKKQLAYDFIRSRIVNGVYGPGHRIVIDQVAKELSLSIIPVREAIRQLEADGFIQYKPYSGAIVSRINEAEYLEALTCLAILEGYATALSSRLMPEEQLLRLEKINDTMNEALYNFDFEKFSELNRDFHTVIYDHCGNTYLTEQIHQAWDKLDRVRSTGFSFVPQRARNSIQEHTMIIGMIRSKAPVAEIEQFVRQHKINTVKAFENRQF